MQLICKNKTLEMLLKVLWYYLPKPTLPLYLYSNFTLYNTMCKINLQSKISQCP